MDRQVEIRPAAPQDLDAWMELVDQVRWSFPSLDTEEGLTHCRRMIYQGILNKNAFCAWYRGKLAGVVCFRPVEICCAFWPWRPATGAGGLQRSC